jgi:hypothetical protein
VVLRVCVLTVTTRSLPSGSSYSLQLAAVSAVNGETTEPVPEFYRSAITLVVQPNSDTANIVRALEGRLVGKTFIALVRGYAADGESVSHMHLAPDSKPVATAVAAARAESR